jgi:hypothetical protein
MFCRCGGGAGFYQSNDISVTLRGKNLKLPRRFNYEESNANNCVTIPSTLLKKIVNMLSKNGGGAGFVVYKK